MPFLTHTHPRLSAATTLGIAAGILVPADSIISNWPTARTWTPLASCCITFHRMTVIGSWLLIGVIFSV